MSVRYQVLPEQWGHQYRFKVCDTVAHTTVAIRSSRRIADEDVLLLNLAGPKGRTVHSSMPEGT